MEESARERPKTPQAVFDRVAPYYDTFNSLLSLGIDRSWRRQTARALELAPGARVLDVATGTGALASALIANLPAGCSVVGCDLNTSMLAIARKRVERQGLPLTLVHCDAMRLPFADASFDAATIAFAIDDMPDRVACARELFRVLRPGGKLALLELSQPDSEPFRSAYRLYLKTFGRLRAQGYDHLAEEILTYRGANAVRALLGDVGFGAYQVRSLTGGIARLHLCSRAARTA